VIEVMGPSYKEQLYYVSMLLAFPYIAPISPQKAEAVAKYPLLRYLHTEGNSYTSRFE